MAVHEMVIFAAVVLSAVALVWVWTNNSAGSAHRHGRALLEDVHVKHQKLHDVHDPFHEKLIQYFPQARLCSRQWVKDYGKMHARIRAGLEDPYYFVSVAVAAGLADRIIGMVSQFYVGALLQQRAFVTHNWGLLPNFNSTCESPYFDWLTPLNLPDEVLESVKTSYKGLAKNEFGYGIFPNTVDTKEYNSQIWINCEVFKEDRCDAKGFHERNLTAMPKCNPKVPYIVSTSNRGYTYAIATNPYHRAQFYEYGVRPEEAFMCGFFSLCYPSKPVEKMYGHLWEALRQPNAFTIGIQVRFGDDAMADGARNHTPAEALLAAQPWFDCATKIENLFAPAGQKVLWFLISDSHELRQAATEQYGAKLLTESKQKVDHVACQTDDGSTTAKTCSQSKLDLAFQKALGATLTFSLTQYQVITHHSGFGRMGAWMSGRWHNLYTIIDGQPCDATTPTPPYVSSSHWSGI